MEDNKIRHAAEVKKYFEENGVSGIAEFLKRKLEKSFNVEINIGVTGDCGAGKSSFINAIRGYDDEGAARTGLGVTTTEPTEYSHSEKKFEKIKFWDLPGMGSLMYPDLETYCEKTNLEKYDTFLIFTASRFTYNHLKLAEKVKSIKKSFFLVRTKMDQVIQGERRKKAFNEEATLKEIREDCWYYLKDLAAGNEDVFLISNHETAKWDFDRLKLAILNVLPLQQKECLTLSLLNLSKNLIKRKVEVLRGRIWKVAAASGAASIAASAVTSAVPDCDLLTEEMDLYKSQLGIPEDSKEFQGPTLERGRKIQKFFVKGAEEINNLLTRYATRATVGEFARYIPLVGPAIVGCTRFAGTYYFLNECLNKLEETALGFLDETSHKIAGGVRR